MVYLFCCWLPISVFIGFALWLYKGLAAFIRIGLILSQHTRQGILLVQLMMTTQRRLVCGLCPSLQAKLMITRLAGCPDKGTSLRNDVIENYTEVKVWKASYFNLNQKFSYLFLSILRTLCSFSAGTNSLYQKYICDLRSDRHSKIYFNRNLYLNETSVSHI